MRGCVDALVCEVWDVFGIEVGKVEERENRKMRKVKEQRKENEKLDPVGSNALQEMMKLCTGSVQDTMRRQQLVIDDIGPVEDIHAFIYCTKWSGVTDA